MGTRFLSKSSALYWVLLAGFFAVPLAGVYPVFVLKVICFALFACAFNLLLGFTGLLSFGHAAFFGGAGYMAGHAIKVWGLTPELGLLLGTSVAAVLGYLMGSLAIRRQGIYFAMITLALAQMLFFFCLQTPMTGGEDGLQGVPRGRLFGLVSLESDVTLYYVVLVIAALGFATIVRIVHSPFGEVLMAIRENEPRAVSLGYDTAKFKLLAFVLSASLAGLAGSLKTIVLGFATLTDVHWSMSGLVILMTLVGGLGTKLGPVVGALVVISLETQLGDIGRNLVRITGLEWFNVLGESATVVTGLVFVVCVLTFRQGIVGRLLQR